MVVSLYVCEIPNNITREDIEHVFSEIEGYLETRTKIANDKRTIAFIDYQTEQDAKCARETLQGFKFSAQDKGLIIKISDNTKGGQSQNFYNKNTSSTQNRNLTRKRNRSNSSSMSRGDNNNMNVVVTSSSTQQQQQVVAQQQQQQAVTQQPSTQQQQIELNNILSTLSSTQQQQQQPHLLQHGYHNPLFTNPNLLKILNEQQTALSPLGVNKNDNNTTQQQQQQQMPLQNQQQLINSLQTLKMLYDQINKGNNNNNSAYSSNSNNNNNKAHIQQQGGYKGFVDDFEKYDEDIKSYEHFSANATKIVYVEGIPYDAHEREIAHIFRPFPGFQGIRIIPKEKNGKKTIICFIDFENVIQSTLCIQTLQGYRFDKNDSIGLHFSYGVSKNNKK